MINTLKIFDELKETMDASAARKIAETMGVMYEELKNTVTKAEFNELKEIVKELAEAQKRTEQRVEELVEAQKHSEERLTRLELTVAELVEAQKLTEKRVAELAEAQKRTENELRELVKAHSETRKMLGGLSDAVGYGLEDRAIKSLPEILKNKYGIEVSGPLVRKFVRYNGKRDEVNIYGIAKKGDQNIYIIGEAKSRLGKKHIDDFLKLVTRLEENRIISGEKFLLTITYSVEPEIEEYAKNRGLTVIWSFEI